MYPAKLILPDELLQRVDNLFDVETGHSSIDSTITEDDISLPVDLQCILPELPNFADYRIDSPDTRRSRQIPTRLLYALRTIALNEAVLSGNFTRDVSSYNSEAVNGMATERLSATKRAYAGSLVVKRTRYELPPGSAVYQLDETYWADWHGDDRLSITIVSPPGTVTRNSRGADVFVERSLWTDKEKLDQLRNLEHTLTTFGV